MSNPAGCMMAELRIGIRMASRYVGSATTCTPGWLFSSWVCSLTWASPVLLNEITSESASASSVSNVVRSSVSTCHWVLDNGRATVTFSAGVAAPFSPSAERVRNVCVSTLVPSVWKSTRSGLGPHSAMDVSTALSASTSMATVAVPPGAMSGVWTSARTCGVGMPTSSCAHCWISVREIKV